MSEGSIGKKQAVVTGIVNIYFGFTACYQDNRKCHKRCDIGLRQSGIWRKLCTLCGVPICLCVSLCLSVSALSMFVSVCICVSVLCLWRPEEGIRSLGAAVIGGSLTLV